MIGAIQEMGLLAVPEVVERVAKLKIADDIKGNVDILCGYAWPAVLEAQGIAQRIKQRLRKHIWMEYAYSRSLWMRRLNVHRARMQPVDVLVTFVPYHENYKELLYPVVEALGRRNISVGLFSPVRTHKLEKPSNIAHVLSQFDVVTLGTYKNAKAAFGELRQDIDTLSSWLSLNHAATTATSEFFQNYSWERSLFRRVLELTQPKFVFGLHFVTKPGYLAAIKDVPPFTRPNLILLQHGSIFNQRHLDFKGADKVILWGNRFKQYLPDHSHLPTPPAVVIGNPGLAKLRRETHHLRSMGGQRNPTVVFIANPDVPVDAKWDVHARKILIMAADQMESTGVVYRSHPSPKNVAKTRQLWRAGHLGRCQLDIGSPLAEALSEADVVVGTFSTVLLEAMAVGVPVIQLIPEELPVSWPDIEMVSASSAEELVGLLNRLICDKSYREAIVEQEGQGVKDLFGDHGNAAERIADEIDAELRRRHV